MTTTEPVVAGKYDVKTPYDLWQESEGIPIIRGYHIEDLKKVPVKPWPRKGGLGTFINLEGAEQADDAYICEIPPGGSLKPQKHLFEEMIVILQGRGATTIWNEGGAKQTFEWQEGSMFSPPLNVWHQHFNGQGNKTVRYLAVTNAPLVINVFRNPEFIFNNQFNFTDRYGSQGDFFSAQGKLYASVVGKSWESNFVTDIRNFKLYDYKQRGAGGTNVKFTMASNAMGAHISEFPVGTYKKGHKHGPGAHVIILSGEGYSLMWPEGKPRQKIDWHEGSMFVPPDQWFHQHFNVGKSPARYLAITWSSAKYGIRRVSMAKATNTYASVKEGGYQIDYKDEDQEIIRLFQQEVSKRGGTVKMAEFFK